MFSIFLNDPGSRQDVQVDERDPLPSLIRAIIFLGA